MLAAGAGRRYAGPTPKLLARLADGTTLVGRALELAAGAGLDHLAVVVGSLGPAELPTLPAEVTVLTNPRWRDGQATSLAVAIDWARALDAPALTVALGDQPGIGPAAWRAVARADAPLAVATYRGRRGHPVRLGAEVWDDLPRHGDSGARSLLATQADTVLEVPCTGDPRDIDTVEDLADWIRRG